MKKRVYVVINKGFTLVELLVVIILISLIAVITVPTFLGYGKSSRESLNKTQEKIIIDAAKKYVIYNEVNGNVCTSELASKGYLNKSDIKDVRTDKVFSNSCVKISCEEDGCEYNFVDECDC